MQRRLRYADLERLGIVNNRETLGNWIRKQGFPRGQLTGPNSRTWGEDEVRAWLDSRPTAIKQDLPKPTGRRGRPRKADRAGVEA
jgi:predicted DNA-binding transcriptional regulator AlpA